MSLYTNQIKTHILDPVYFSQQRAKFSIPKNKVFMTNMRLINVGYVAPNANTKIGYPAGLWGQIRNIYLLDGGTDIDKLYDVGPIMSFKVSNNPNDVNVSKNNTLNKAPVGYISEKDKPQNQDHGTVIVNGKVLSDSKGWLSLLDVFDYLKKTGFISTTMYQDLQLVIEFANPLPEANATGVIKPALVVDEIVNESQVVKINKELMGTDVVFKAIERDSVGLPLATKDVKQRKTYNLKGFDGKTLNRVLICKSSLDGKQVAMKNEGEKVNFIVNGRQILPYDGIDAPAKKVALLTGSWGGVNLLPGFNIPLFADTNAVRYTATPLDFIGLNIKDKIDDLQFNYERTPSASNVAIVDAMNLLVYGEVDKVIQPNGGNYVVSYL